MKTDYILELLNNCESLKGFTISADFLGKGDKSVCLKASDTSKTERVYCDGSGIFSSEFELDFRLIADEVTNINNRHFFEKLSSELTSFGILTSFPSCDGLIQPLKIEITEGAKLIKDDIHSAKYTLILRIYFLKEKRG